MLTCKEPSLKHFEKNQVKDMPAKSIDNSMLAVGNKDVYNKKTNPEFSVGCEINKNDSKCATLNTLRVIKLMGTGRPVLAI